MTTDCFALLDDAQATSDRPTSRLYRGFEREHRSVDPAGLDAFWRTVEADQRAGLHAVLLIDYEWGAKLLQAGCARLGAADGASLRVLMFRDCARLSATEAGQWLSHADAGFTASSGAGSSRPAAGVMNLAASVDEAGFFDAIAAIHGAIAAGETYQVNYTYRLHGQVYGSPIALYARLRDRQPVAHGALIVLPGAESAGADSAAADDADAPTHVLSCSPELFLRHTAGKLAARPMKGTAGRVAGAEGDSETARHLSIDIKNRAENLMIVDLLRNDLGRLAVTGSVKVPELFAVEPYSTVFQMTSTVEARLRPGVGMPEVLRAAFPCGSITGAPKHHTMGLIAGLENTPRGLYCGAIGWIDAPRADGNLGDFCLSVAIRTLTLGRETRGVRAARLGIGAGIVADSVAADEYAECRLKARFLTGLDPGFQLFETMLAASVRDRPNGVRHFDRHLDRMARSAEVLGFRFDRAAAAETVVACARALSPAAQWRLRLGLAHDGRTELTHAELKPLRNATVTLLLSDVRLPDVNPLGAHKTTQRAAYDEGVRAAERADAFDSLFFTADGRLVEGGRSSVFVRLDGRWATPPLADGALPGVMRACLLEASAWNAAERSLTRGDLQRAQAIVVCNALRGVLPARLRHESLTTTPS